MTGCPEGTLTNGLPQMEQNPAVETLLVPHFGQVIDDNYVPQVIHLDWRPDKKIAEFLVL